MINLKMFVAAALLASSVAHAQDCSLKLDLLVHPVNYLGIEMPVSIDNNKLVSFLENEKGYNVSNSESSQFRILLLAKPSENSTQTDGRAFVSAVLSDSVGKLFSKIKPNLNIGKEIFTEVDLISVMRNLPACQLTP